MVVADFKILKYICAKRACTHSKVIKNTLTVKKETLDKINNGFFVSFKFCNHIEFDKEHSFRRNNVRHELVSYAVFTILVVTLFEQII